MRIKLLLITLSFVLGGCATTRGVVDLETTPAPTQAAPAVAADATPVFIGTITDDRRFELKPPEPSTPSLKDGQINNTELTERAIARKRNTYGKALGDVMLPEGRTVKDVVRENLTQVLTERGYRVVDAPGEGVSTLNVSIEQFWAWATPGFWAIKAEFRGRLAFSGIKLLHFKIKRKR